MRLKFTFCIFFFLVCVVPVFGQSSINCFLDDFEPKTAEIPPYSSTEKPSEAPTVQITVNPDTLGKISKYIFGNAVAVWVGNDVNNPTLISHLKKLAPTVIRFPGGSWSDGYFWSGNPGDLPTTVPDGTNNGNKVPFYPQLGPNGRPTVNSYYNMCEQLGSQGLITVNYGYARYGLSEKPAEQAAHYAADWVRYDSGRTKFWEIGNESGGPWSGGWMIDTAQNKDGQPQIVSGELYGKHFKIFVDSMKTAAKETGATIYVGGQILHYDGTNSWNSVDRNWNEGFFREVGDSADFYVIHNYFGSSPIPKSLLDIASIDPKKNMDFIKQDIAKKHAYLKPVALTEYNMSGVDGRSKQDTAKISIINGMQAVILFNELIKNNYGLSTRWLIANWETDGMFYYGNNASIRWNPRPDFYYAYYLQRFTGDHALRTSSTGGNNVIAYSSAYNSGETAVVVINKGTKDEVVKVNLPGKGVGEKYYVYSLTGDSANGDFSLNVYVNGVGPEKPNWGPIKQLTDIPAQGFIIGNEIKFSSPPKSVQFILTEAGNNVISSAFENNGGIVAPSLLLYQNYPNPFNPVTKIKYQTVVRGNVNIKIYNVLGEEVFTLLNEEKPSGMHEVDFDGSFLTSGTYFYRLSSGNYSTAKKLMILK